MANSDSPAPMDFSNPLDSLAQAYESRLQSQAVWEFETPPGLQTYLNERGIELLGNELPCEALFELEIRHRVPRLSADDETVILASLLQQFPAMSVAVIRRLAQLEWQLRKIKQSSMTVHAFVQQLTALTESEQKILAQLLAGAAIPETLLQEEREAENGHSRFSDDGIATGQMIGPYEVVARIGRGGMGEVYRARQLRPLPRDVAVKVVRHGWQTSSGILSRFDVERQALAMMDHPHIARVFDAGITSDHLPYFAMEFVDGIPMTRYCDMHRLTLEERLALFLQVCRAIQHAHQKGIIHRDIKPGNVLVATTDVGPAVKVIDFGLARALQSDLLVTDESQLTSPGQFVGTLRYMSPEQTLGSSGGVDIRSDVYSLGILLFELLTGSTPLEESLLRKQSMDVIISAIRNDDPPRPSVRLNAIRQTASTISELRRTDTGRLTSILKGDLDWIVMKALEKEPRRRYVSASHLAEDVERFLASEPVEARPPSLSYQLSKSLRRHKVAAAVTCMVTVSLIVTSTMTVRGLIAEKNEEISRAETAAEKLKTREAETGQQLAEERQRTLEREKILQSLLTAPFGSEQGEAKLTAIDNAIEQVIMDDVSRVDLQLEKLDVLHHLQRFAEFRSLIGSIQPITKQQEGRLRFWMVRKSTSFEEQIRLATTLIDAQSDYQLVEPDLRFLGCLKAASRREAIGLLDTLLIEFPQHEPSRKLLMTLLLLDGQSDRLDLQLEQARLLFPSHVDVELTSLFAFALRGERQLAERQLAHVRTLNAVSETDLEFHAGLMDLILVLDETLSTSGIETEGAAKPNVQRMLTQVIEFLQSVNQAPEVMKEVFGPASAIGQPVSSEDAMGTEFLAGLGARVSVAAGMQLIGNHTFMRNVISELESLSPIPGDALFLRTCGLLKLTPETFREALEELDLAVTAPCVFPGLRKQIFYEAAMCHMGVYFEGKEAEQLQKAGDLASEWAQMPGSLSALQTTRIIQMLQLNARYDEALRLIERYRDATPDAADQLLHSELQVLMAAERYPEALHRIDDLLQSRDQMAIRESDLIALQEQATDAMKKTLGIQESDGNTSTEASTVDGQ